MTQSQLSTDMAAYYRARSVEYDEVYAVEARSHDLSELRDWLAEEVRGQTVLEAAAGTGYWTQAAARTARSIVATDLNQEPLAFAAARNPGPHVSFLAADAFDLPLLPERPQAGMAHLWWSHVRNRDQARFLEHLAGRLEPGAKLLMIDETFVPGLSTPVSRRDPDGNGWQTRMLRNGALFQIVKNYPSADTLRTQLEPMCTDIKTRTLAHFWAVSAVFKDRPTGSG